MKIFPKKIDFFEYFDNDLKNLSRGTQELVNIFEKFDEFKERASNMQDIEHDGDIITHDIMRQLNSSFLTPIDREDIHALASRIDDVLDEIWSAVERMVVFKFKEPTPQSVQMARDLHRTTLVLQKAFSELRAKDYDHVQEHCIEINRLENKLDRDVREALGALFEDFKDEPLMVIKWKEIYEHLEDAADMCEDVANILESIMLKYA
jgi:predicted phosphate transport protein (TIGR00153 family)